MPTGVLFGGDEKKGLLGLLMGDLSGVFGILEEHCFGFPGPLMDLGELSAKIPLSRKNGGAHIYHVVGGREM